MNLFEEFTKKHNPNVGDRYTCAYVDVYCMLRVFIPVLQKYRKSSQQVDVCAEPKMKELKQNLNSLLALQKEYIKLVEEESPDYSESLSYYTQLLEDLKKQVKIEPIEYAKTIAQNPDFQQCIQPPNGI